MDGLSEKIPCELIEIKHLLAESQVMKLTTDELGFKISKDQARLFALTIADDIAEYVKNHQAEYALLLLDEKAGEQKHD